MYKFEIGTRVILEHDSWEIKEVYIITNRKQILYKDNTLENSYKIVSMNGKKELVVLENEGLIKYGK